MQWLALFFFYSFVGWCFECAYVFVHEKHFINRGFMRGPILPIYGSAGIMMLLVSRPFYDNFLLVYIAGCIGATILEYLTGVLMESLFGVRYWDYSHKKFNYKGHISLESSLFWGVPTVIFTHVLQIPVERFLLSIPYNILTVVTVVAAMVASFDFCMAFRTAIDLRDVLMYMEKAKDELGRIQKRLDSIIAFKGEEVKEGIGNSRIVSTVGAIGSGITGRFDALSDAVGRSFAGIREKISINPSAYAANVREEIAELYARYKVLVDRVTPGPIKSFSNWYRKRTILGNPTMVSEKFGESLRELRERIRG